MSTLTPQEAATLAAALDPSAAARADADEQQQGAHVGELLSFFDSSSRAAAAEQQQGAHRRALLALDTALAEIQRLVGEITGGAQ